VRVLYLSSGHTAHDDRFIEAIAADGHEPVLWTGSPTRPEQIAEILARVKPDVVHAGPLEPMARLAAEASARPLAAVSWGFDLLLDTQGPDRDRIAWTVRQADALLVDCQAAAAVAVQMGMASNRIFTLPWGVDLERFRPPSAYARAAWRRRMGWEDAIVLISARAHEELYGIDVIIDGFAAVAASLPRLRLLVLGDGSLTPRLVAYANDRCPSGSVAFAGSVPNSELAEHLGGADIYVAASRVDGSSVTLLEAMAVGLPVVVSDIPGNREWVTSGFNGLLFPVADALALGSSIMELVGDSSTRATLGARGLAVVQKRADWQKNRLILDAFYRAAVGAAEHR
jgi:L-malate glycosyltransferase